MTTLACKRKVTTARKTTRAKLGSRRMWFVSWKIALPKACGSTAAIKYHFVYNKELNIFRCRLPGCCTCNLESPDVPHTIRIAALPHILAGTQFHLKKLQGHAIRNKRGRVAFNLTYPDLRIKIGRVVDITSVDRDSNATAPDEPVSVEARYAW
jgi:hypothetical protein